MDLYPTICDLAGAKIERHSIEGRSILPTLLGATQPPVRDLWYFTRREVARYQGKRSTRFAEAWEAPAEQPIQTFELYNVKSDPLEENDLAQNRS